MSSFCAAQKAIQNGQVAETYFLEHPVSMDGGAAAVDRAFDELTPILLAMTFLTGMSVTVQRSAPSSDVQVLQPTDHWPRARSLQQPSPIVSSDAVFFAAIEAFVRAWPAAGYSEKVLLLVHHWIDALGCWSLEDLYLSTTTLLQVISATEADRQGSDLSFFSGLQGAASRAGVAPPSHDWIKMRNDPGHDGSLSATRFPNKSKLDCAEVAADVLNWIDSYIEAVLRLGSAAKPRFKKADLYGLNAYSLN